jgi:hypothetical protein
MTYFQWRLTFRVSRPGFGSLQGAPWFERHFKPQLLKIGAN